MIKWSDFQKVEDDDIEIWECKTGNTLLRLENFTEQLSLSKINKDGEKDLSVVCRTIDDALNISNLWLEN